MTECQVCISKYNKTKNAKLECPYCKYDCCRECLKTYLLGTVRDPHCMNCKRVLDREILSTFLPKSWLMRELKEHREHILLDREKAMLPATQPYLDKAIQLDQFDKQIREKAEEVNKARLVVHELELQMGTLQRQRYRLSVRDPTEAQEGGAASSGEDDTVVARRTTVRPCPKDGCKGYLSSRYKCGVCETWVCSHCNQIKKCDRDMEHTCKDDDVKTVEYLKSQAKPCPKCGVAIEKISGCDQMWCVNCHVAFSWSKGEIVHGVIHNPHYYQWLSSHQRANAREDRTVDDLEREMCGQQFPSFAHIHEHLFRVVGSSNTEHYRREDVGYYLRQQDNRYQHPLYVKLRNLHRSLMHIQHDELPRHRPPERIDHLGIHMRVSYMMNQLGEDEWRRKLQIMEKKREKDRDIFFVLDMVVNTSGDLFRNLLTFSTLEELENHMKEFDALREYANKQLMVIQKRYNNVVPMLRSDFYILSSSTYKEE